MTERVPKCLNCGLNRDGCNRRDCPHRKPVPAGEFADAMQRLHNSGSHLTAGIPPMRPPSLLPPLVYTEDCD